MYYPLPRGVVRWISLQKSEYRGRGREREGGRWGEEGKEGPREDYRWGAPTSVFED